MTYRKRTTAIQVRVTVQEKQRLERRAKQCGLSLSGYLRKAGDGKPILALSSQQFHDFYQQVSSLRKNLANQSIERTAARLNELEGQILTAYTSRGVDDGSN